MSVSLDFVCKGLFYRYPVAYKLCETDFIQINNRQPNKYQRHPNFNISSVVPFEFFSVSVVNVIYDLET